MLCFSIRVASRFKTPNATNNNNTSTLLRALTPRAFKGSRSILSISNCHCYDPSRTKVLNDAAWTNTPSGSFSPSAAFYNDYRYQRRPSELNEFRSNFPHP